MDTLIINQQSKVEYTKAIQQLIKEVVQKTSDLMRLPENSETSILIVDNDYIQELNFAYRKYNQVTDVLSFAMKELGENEPEFETEERVNILGDIVISLEKAVEQSEDYGHSLEREIAYLTAHGMLHLLGYDHEAEESQMAMREMEERILKDLKLER